MKHLYLIYIIFILLFTTSCVDRQQGNNVIIVNEVPSQPLVEHVSRLIERLDYVGNPLSSSVKESLHKIFELEDGVKKSNDIQAILDSLCVIGVTIQEDGKIIQNRKNINPIILEKEWRMFLVKVNNPLGVKGKNLKVKIDGIEEGVDFKTTLHGLTIYFSYDNCPLSGLEVEYALMEVYTNELGTKNGHLKFNLDDTTGFDFQPLQITFNAEPTYPISFQAYDVDKSEVVSSFEIRDKWGRVYPSQPNRREKDFIFQHQVYRDGMDSIRLPEGIYSVTYTRGPEYKRKTDTVTIDSNTTVVKKQLERWIDMTDYQFYSGDHHIHAAGCGHYPWPGGVDPNVMIKHIMGEDLKVGCVLNWGPGFDYQKQFFSGAVDTLSTYPYTMRYDIEVSGYGSHNSGHLCLLRLSDQIYPGGESDDHWPTLGLNTLKWAKSQGAYCGPAHSGLGLRVQSEDLPNYEVPAFNGIGANEFIVDITHRVPGPNGALVPAVDFISAGNTIPIAELNIWYHVLNCGFRPSLSGETDFPCMSGERVGRWRSYVKLDQDLEYDRWVEGIHNGRNYVSDGRSHWIDFKVDGFTMGDEKGELRLQSPREVEVAFQATANLENQRPYQGDYRENWQWNIEKSKYGNEGEVLAEVIVNGYPVDSIIILADGQVRSYKTKLNIEYSSWVAMRIFQSSHTNPVFIIVDDKPIRANKKSAEWCLAGVDQCWESKNKFYAEEEIEDAIAAYDHARKVYKKIIKESVN